METLTRTDNTALTRAQRRWVAAFVIVVSGYVAAQMLSDIASLRILSLFGFSVDGGTLVYPLTFTLRDLVHKVAGLRAARWAIAVAAVVNLVMAALFWIVGNLPADLAVGPQPEFAALLAPVWRIVFASIIAEVISELIDGSIYERWTEYFGNRHQWGRVLSSNSVALPIDSAIFVLIAFAGDVPTDVLWSIFWANVIVKGAVTVGSIPLIYSVPAPERPF